MRAYSCLNLQIFEYGDYYIRTVQDSHIESIRTWRNAQIEVLRQNSPIEPKKQIEYFETNIWPTMTQSFPSNILVSFFKMNELIGYGGLVHIVWEHASAEISFLLSPDRIKDKTVYSEDFTAFLHLIKQMAFKDIRIRHLFTETYDIRPLHISILESNGFTCKEILQGHVRIKNEDINSIFHECLNQ